MTLTDKHLPHVPQMWGIAEADVVSDERPDLAVDVGDPARLAASALEVRSPLSPR